VDIEAYVGIVGAILAFVGAVASGALASRANKQAHELDRRRRLDTRTEDLERIVHQYRDPLLDAAQALQSRIFNILAQNYLGKFLHCGDADEERYARDYTVFVLAEYLCWVEIVRRELRFLDLGDVVRNRDLLAQLYTIQLTIQHDKAPPRLRVFRGKQRAIAELMMVPTGAADGPRSECRGFAAFSRALDDDPVFAAWFAPLHADVQQLVGAGPEEHARLVLLQRQLIELIDFLDPEHTRLPTPHRAKLPAPDAPLPAAATPT
jgi:hypothetical protein